MKVKKRRKMIIILAIIFAAVVGIFSYLSLPKFGGTPKGEILERMEASPNFRDGKFHNFEPRIDFFEEKSFFKTIGDYFFTKVENLKPSTPLPSIKTNLKEIDREENVMIWLGHSSLFMQIDGVRFLIDPVLVTASPFSFYNKSFPGTEVYAPDDIPEIDYLLITHDHWDHLDYETVTSIKDRVEKVICGLGNGAHFRRWKYNADEIIELDWNENATLKNDITLHVLPAQHYSGRKFLGGNKTLWVSFMIEAPSSNIFISGDTGYGKHFAEIGQKFPEIDLATFEFGQYGYQWRDIHIIPEDLGQAIKDLNPQRIFTTHNSKYQLGKHPWKEPLEYTTKLTDEYGFNIMTPMIGELIYLNDLSQEFTTWWKDVE